MIGSGRWAGDVEGDRSEADMQREGEERTAALLGFEGGEPGDGTVRLGLEVRDFTRRGGRT